MNSLDCDVKVIHHEFKQWHEPIPEKVVKQDDECQLIIIDWEDKVNFI